MSKKVVLSGWDVKLPFYKNFNMLSQSLMDKKTVRGEKYFSNDAMAFYYKFTNNPNVVKFFNNKINFYEIINKIIDDVLKKAKITHEILIKRKVKIYLAGQGARADLLDYQGFYDKNDAEDVACSPGIKNLHSNQYAQDYISNKLFKNYQLNWPPITIYCASNSALMATHIGYQEISYGATDIVIILSWSDILLQDVSFMDSQNMLAKEYAQPFSKYSDGVMLSAGYSVLILENAEQAKKRVDQTPIYINQSLFMQNNASRHSGGTTFNFYTISKSILKTLDLSQYKPSDIGAIFIHGNGSIISDKAEAMAITNVFKDFNNIPILSYKGQIGYVSNCSGIIDLMIMADCLNRGIIIPSVSTYPIDDALDLNFLSNKSIMPYCGKPMLKLGLGMDGSIIVMILTTN